MPARDRVATAQLCVASTSFLKGSGCFDSIRIGPNRDDDSPLFSFLLVFHHRDHRRMIDRGIGATGYAKGVKPHQLTLLVRCRKKKVTASILRTSLL